MVVAVAEFQTDNNNCRRYDVDQAIVSLRDGNLKNHSRFNRKYPKHGQQSSALMQNRQDQSPRPLSSIQNFLSDYQEVEIVQALSQFLPPSTTQKRYCIDVGARSDASGNPSVSHELLINHQDYLPPDRQQRWFGILIQPDSKLYRPLRSLHEGKGGSNADHTARCLQITPSWERGLNERSLVWILRQFASKMPLDFDFMNVDGDRCNNYWILRDFWECQTYRPRLVCVPYDPSSLSSDVWYVPPREDKLGVPSLLALVEMASQFQYQLVMTNKRCAFFVPKKLFQQHLRSSIRRESKNDPKRVAFPESRDQPTSPTRLDVHHTRLPSSPRPQFEKDKEAVISAGMGWLAERRKALERTNDVHKTKPIQFKKQVTTAWQKRKATIIDSLKRQNNRRRDQNRARNNTMNRQKRAKDPPENQSGKAGYGEFKVLGSNKVDLEEKQRQRGVDSSIPSTTLQKYVAKKDNRPDPPGVEGFASVQQILSVDPDESRIDEEDEAETIEASDASPSRELSEEEPSTLHSSTDQSSSQLNHPIKQSAPLSEGWQNEEEEIIFSADSGEEDAYHTNESDIPLTNENGAKQETPFSDSRVIDMKPRFAHHLYDSTTEKYDASRSFVANLRYHGFAIISGTGISRFVCSDALLATRLLLQGAEEPARRSCIDEMYSGRGYSPLCTEQSGNSDLKDMVRKFRVGPVDARISNVWPNDGLIDDDTKEYIQASLQNYHDRLAEISVELLECISEVLAEEGFVLDPVAARRVRNDSLMESSLFTAWSCCRGSRHVANKPIVDDYRDQSTLSIVLKDAGDSCATFQHKTIDGLWKNVDVSIATTDDPIFLVYAGDALSHLTRGFFPTLTRRLVPADGHESLNAMFVSKLDPLDSLSEYAFMACSTPKARGRRNWDEDDDSLQEEKKQKASLLRLSSQLEEADRFFRSNPDKIAGVSKPDNQGEMASTNVEPFQVKGDARSNTEDLDFGCRQIGTDSDFLTTKRRCRLESEGSKGIELPILERNVAHSSLKADSLKNKNPFRLAMERLTTRYKEEKSLVDNHEAFPADADSYRRSQELSKLLPPMTHARYPSGIVSPRKRGNEPRTDDFRDPPSAQRCRLQGSPGRPILVDDEERRVDFPRCKSSQAKEPKLSRVDSMQEQIQRQAFERNLVDTYSRNANDKLVGLQTTMRTRRSTLQRPLNLRVRRDIDPVNRQDINVREKRQYFMKLKSHLRDQNNEASNPCRLTEVSTSDAHLKPSECTKPSKGGILSTSSPITDSPCQSVGSRTLETMEASLILEKLLSEGTPLSELHPINVHTNKTNDEERSPNDSIQPSRFDQARKDPPEDGAMAHTYWKTVKQDPGMKKSRLASNEFLYDQKITFPQPTVMGNGTPYIPNPEVDDGSNDLKTRIIINYLQPAPEENNASSALFQERGKLTSRQLHQRRIGEMSTKIPNETKQPQNKPWNTISTTVEEVGGSGSTVSELTDEGYKLGCTVPFTWPK